MSNTDKAIKDEAANHIAIWGPYSIFGLIFAIIALAADQLHKYWMIEIYRISDQLDDQGRVFVTSFLDLKMSWNPGISYGLLPQESDLGRYLLAGFSAVAVVTLMLWMSNTASRLVAFSLGLIVGGAVGNLIDRVVHGAVADFFSFHYAGFYWYIFNIADVAITMGVIGLVLDWLWPSHTKVSKAV